MPTQNEIPGVSLIDRLQAENKKLKDDNAELHRSISKLQLFNKILEREVTELKSPVTEEPVINHGFHQQSGPPLPIKRITTYTVIGLLVIASIYSIASLFSGSKSSSQVEPSVTEKTEVPTPAETKTTNTAPLPATKKSATVIPPNTVTASQRALALRIDTSRRRRALMEDNTPYDSIGASNFGLGHFKVLSRAYFYNKPDFNTKSELYINHLTRTSLEALDEKNGFVFVVFKNEAGKVTRGWLRKADLKEANASGR
ncbi:MAG: hypothetical protein ABI415_05145 [Flavitalea sp.]